MGESGGRWGWGRSGNSHHPDDEVDGVDWRAGLAGKEECGEGGARGGVQV